MTQDKFPNRAKVFNLSRLVQLCDGARAAGRVNVHRATAYETLGTLVVCELKRRERRAPVNCVSAVLVLALLSFHLTVQVACGATNQIQYLSGTDKDHTVPWEFRVSAGRNSGFWTNIPVPSCWDTKGFGSYEYGNDTTSELGEYRHAFTAPASWATQRVFLVFEGAMTDTEARINGQLPRGTTTSQPPPVHQGGFYEFSYEVTDNLNYGASNLLEVTVRKKSANTSINQAERQADYWTFGGIFRPVYLEACPPAHIDRVAVDANADGHIAVHTFLSGVSHARTIAARVTDGHDQPLGSEFTAPVAAGASNVLLATTLPTPQPWSPEFPHCYKLTIQLRDGTNLVHSRTETIGFRTITFTNSVGFFLNGKKIMLRGVNRHDFWPDSGRTTSRALSIADIELMKSMNLNAVRMSHYPPAKHFLEECDRLGLLVINELAGWQAPPYDDTIAPQLVRELVVRDVNHPCIFAWANGNEGGSNPTVDDDFGLWDPQRRNVLHPANWESEIAGGVRTHHYATYRQVTNYLGAGKPVFLPTEIQHGLYDGGGGAGLEDHWNAMRAAPNSGGMFIWALLDEGLVRDDQNRRIDVAGDLAPDGILGPHREKEASYHTVKALWSPVQITSPTPATFNGTLAVENRFDFTDLNQCTFRWQLGRFPDPTASTNALSAGFLPAVDSGAFAGPAIAPTKSGSLNLSLPGDWARYDALRVTATDPHGREIYTWTWPLQSPAQIRQRITSSAHPNHPGLLAGVTGSQLSVTNGARVYRFDLTNGRLLGVTVATAPIAFTDGPRPVTGTWPVTNVSHGFADADYVVTLNNVTDAADGFQWRVRANGWVNLRYRYTLTGLQQWFGVTFEYPETNVTAMRWLGQGPYRVWKNRLPGQEVAVHYKTANHTDTGKQWGYPEFAGYHGQLYWAQLETTQQPITLVAATPDLFFRVLTPPVAQAKRPSVSPKFPAGNLSLLHAINAIGNKFATPAVETTGPQSAAPFATGLYTGEVDLYFGALPAPGPDRAGD
jgi:hypothetical protein